MVFELLSNISITFTHSFYGFLDINKFLWMVRIGGSTDRVKHIKENDYYTPSGEFRVDQEGSSTLLNCLMYKMSYYKFGSVYTEGGMQDIYFVVFSLSHDIYCRKTTRLRSSS